MSATTSEKHRMMIAHTIEVAQLLGLKTIAEGVETRTERDLLTGLGCDRIQGFLIAEPMQSQDFLRWMMARASMLPGPTDAQALQKRFGT
jgi:EAL domain-containing protein (putative c-di-GMP-specific phosphodiesterase class I)